MFQPPAPAAACRYHALQGAVAAAGQQCEALQAQEAGVRVEIEALGRERYKVGALWDGGWPNCCPLGCEECVVRNVVLLEMWTPAQLPWP